MRVRTLFLYLIGNRQAILEIAANRRSLWIGLLFVFSAAFAREYDGQDLLAEPWHLFIPLVASFGAASLLFLVVCGSLFLRKEGRPPFFAAFRSFLALFWMTAPLAWLYAVPYERFLSAFDATRVNLWTLAFVAAWRVALMVRVTSVLAERGVLSSLCLVMVFADAVALTIIGISPKPIMDVMAGIRFTESENAIQGMTMLVMCLGFLTAPIWVLGASITLFIRTAKWQVLHDPSKRVSISSGMWILVALSLLVWLPILPGTQREQQLRFQVEREMKGGRIVQGLDLMSSHALSDFPPHWDPPPRLIYNMQSLHILDVMEVLLTHNCTPWVRESYVMKFRRYLGREWLFKLSGNARAQSELPRIVRILEQLPEGSDIATEAWDGETVTLVESFGGLPKESKENLKRLRELAKKKDSGLKR